MYVVDGHTTGVGDPHGDLDGLLHQDRLGLGRDGRLEGRGRDRNVTGARQGVATTRPVGSQAHRVHTGPGVDVGGVGQRGRDPIAEVPHVGRRSTGSVGEGDRQRHKLTRRYVSGG